MGHIDDSNLEWHVSSPKPIDITVSGVASADLSNLKWILDGVVEISGSAITTSDDSNGDAVVTVQLSATDVTTPGVFDWQLHGDVSASGPEVLAEGSMTFHALLSSP